MLCISMSERSTIPATEQNLAVQNDTHGFDEQPAQEAPIFHDVLIDGVPAKAGVGSFGGYSTRIVLLFDPPHAEFGEEFATKYFMFEDNDSGVMKWGHDGRSLLVEKITSEA